MRATFIRHGEAASNEVTDDSRVGNTHAPLTKEGLSQAKSAAAWLSRAYRPLMPELKTGLYASPYRRTMQTAEVIAELLGTDIVEVPDLREISKGDWEGRKVTEVIDLEGKVDPADKPYFRPPNGENWQDVGERVARFVEGLRQTGIMNALLVSHNHPIECGIGRLTGTPVASWEDPHLDYASLTSLFTRRGEDIWTPDSYVFNLKPYQPAA